MRFVGIGLLENSHCSTWCEYYYIKHTYVSEDGSDSLLCYIPLILTWTQLVTTVKIMRQCQHGHKNRCSFKRSLCHNNGCDVE